MNKQENKITDTCLKWTFKRIQGEWVPTKLRFPCCADYMNRYYATYSVASDQTPFIRPVTREERGEQFDSNRAVADLPPAMRHCPFCGKRVKAKVKKS